ncbi:MAG: AMP-binding protein [Aeromicrobium sp.]
MTERDHSFLGELERFGDAPALLSKQGNLTYAELASAADELATSWGPGRHLVLIACTNSIDTVVAQVAALRNGHAAIMAPAASPELLERIANVYQPDIVMTEGEVLVRTNVAPPMHPDLAVLLLTSGSTGSSKLVRLSRRNVKAVVASIIEYLDISATDRAITSLPLHFGYGLSVITTHLEAGASIVVTADSVADPCFWELATEQGITSFAGVPYSFELIDHGGFELPDSLRYVTMSGGKSPVASVRRRMARGQEADFVVVLMYGSTEASARMTYVPPAMLDSAMDAIGQAIPGTEIWLEPVPDSDDPDVGELVFRGDNVMMGYAESLDDLAEGQGSAELYTGDLGRLGDDGLYRWVGRRSRFTKLFGLRIDLDHLEHSLAAKGVTAVCVEAQDRLFVFATAGDQLLDVVAKITGLPRHAIRVKLIDQVPMTENGKVNYGHVRNLADQPVPQKKMRAVRRPTEEAVLHAYALVLHRPDATPTDTFTSLAGDSLSYVELSLRLADLNINTSPGWQHRTISELAKTTTGRRSWPALDSTIVLRAVAIFLIVSNHALTFRLVGSAHVLLAVAGYNFARFQLSDASRAELWRVRWRNLAKVMAPCMAWIIAVAIVFDVYSIDSILMTSGFGSGGGDVRLWFIADYFWIQALVILLLAVPLLDRLQRRSHLTVAIGALLLTSAVRVAHTGWHADWATHHEYQLLAVAWCFAIGWVAALLRGAAARAVLSIVAAVSTFGYFQNDIGTQDVTRDLVLFVGLMILIWAPLLPVPRRLARPLGLVAGASPFIFVSHFQFVPAISDINPWLATVAALAFGVAFERAWSYGTEWMRSRDEWPKQPIPPSANVGTPTSR